MDIEFIKNNGYLLFECISGSRAYGLDTLKSDTDLKGVFYLPKDQFYAGHYVAQINNETNDEVYYELGRFIELLTKNNPNILEVLASPEECILYKHPIMNHLSLDLFLSKLCKDTFAGYATTQIKKARGYKKKIVNPMDKERKSLIDFCYIIEQGQSIPAKDWLLDKDYQQNLCGLSVIDHAKGLHALFYDQTNSYGYKGIAENDNTNGVFISSIPKNEPLVAYLYWNQEAYIRYCKEYKAYWDWVENRNEDRYQTNMDHGKNYDSKNMMHTIRLLQVAQEIIRDGKLNVKRSNREALLKIKSGEEDYDRLIELSDNLMKNIEASLTASPLQDKPDQILIDNILIQMRNKLYSNL